ncbi:MAG: helix-turn-helix transcriptional regulator [Parcubacteria group bacterium]|jgi:transcriptional regulator with XRE-family HTH domain
MKTGENLKKFGEFLYNLRIKKEYTLREMCRKVKYDPSNWSKIERGKISPPSDRKMLETWAKTLGLKKDSKEFDDFICYANVAQGIIPFNILEEKELVAALPAFFRTIKNKKPTKEEIDNMINLIKNA